MRLGKRERQTERETGEDREIKREGDWERERRVNYTAMVREGDWRRKRLWGDRTKTARERELERKRDRDKGKWERGKENV